MERATSDGIDATATRGGEMDLFFRTDRGSDGVYTTDVQNDNGQDDREESAGIGHDSNR